MHHTLSSGPRQTATLKICSAPCASSTVRGSDHFLRSVEYVIDTDVAVRQGLPFVFFAENA